MAKTWRVTEGAPVSRVLLHVPHSALAIPSEIRSEILLSDAQLESELLAMTDAHTALIAQEAMRGSTTPPWMFTNLLSRLVIDPERFPDGREEMEKVGMGAVYTRTSTGMELRLPSPSARQELLQRYFDPYAATFTELVQRRLEANGEVTIIDVHSYATLALPYELHSAGARPAICLGTDPDHTPAWLVDAARHAFVSFDDIEVNSPFSGTYVPLAHYERAGNVRSIMIEIRRDQYMNEVTGQADVVSVNQLGACLAELCSAVDRHATD